MAARSAFTLLFLAPLVYGIYYPQPYLNQILRKLPIAVVDNDLSDLSRQIVETLDASGALRVAVRARTLVEAPTAIGTLTSELVSRGARSDGSLVKAKLASSSPADVLLQPIFNPVGGYASYVVPAAFVLIL